jgi:hypothetical protein
MAFQGGCDSCAANIAFEKDVTGKNKKPEEFKLIKFEDVLKAGYTATVEVDGVTQEYTDK